MNIGEQLRVSKLRFLLYDRPLHPELFDIYDDHHIAKRAYEAHIWVTGCTHVISFYRDKAALSEVVATDEMELPKRGLLLEMPFRGEKDHEHKITDGIRYMMNFQVETMSQAVYTKTHHDLARQGRRRGLFVPFPKWMFDSLTPFTYIDYNAKPNELHVFTFHAFPRDLTVIKIQSIFELG